VTRDHRFGIGPSFPVGVDEELLLVDPAAHRLGVASGRHCLD